MGRKPDKRILEVYVGSTKVGIQLHLFGGKRGLLLCDGLLPDDR